MFTVIEKMDSLLTKIEKAVMLASGFLVVALTLLATFSRYLAYFKVSWYEEVVVFVFALLVFWGSSNAGRDDSHLKLDLLGAKLQSMSQTARFSRYYKYYRLAIESICLITSICGAYYTAEFSLAAISKTPILGIPATLTYFLTLFVGFAGLTLRYLGRLITTSREPSK